jgi:hypothetical protein
MTLTQPMRKRKCRYRPVMPRTCDHCGSDMTLRRDDADADSGAAMPTSSATWWNCTCGRTLADFSASTSMDLPFTQEDDQG